MTSSLVNLDDRSFDSLVEEGKRLLPLVAPAWTNHNPSDPGITLLELLAYVSELLMYRVNRVGRQSRLGFLRLLCGATDDPAHFDGLDDAALDEAIRAVVAGLSRVERAVTSGDFERLASRAAAAAFEVPVRVCGVAGVRIEKIANAIRVEPRAADFTVVVLPPPGHPAADEALALERIRDALRPACLLGSHAHVVDALLLVLAVGATIRTHAHDDADLWLAAVRAALSRHFSPYPGDGPHPAGWPFGRGVQVADVFEALAAIDGIDGLSDVRILGATHDDAALDRDDTGIGIQVGVVASVSRTTRFGALPGLGADRLIVAGDGRLAGVALKPYELVRLTIRPEDLKVIVESHRVFTDQDPQ